MNINKPRNVVRCVMVVFYCLVGALHLRALDALLPIVPIWVPMPPELCLSLGFASSLEP
jgi:hypothetical protein